MKTTGSSRTGKPKPEWNEQLCAALTALELLAGPPLGTNAQLGNLLRRLGLAIAKLKDLSEEEFLSALSALAERSHRNIQRSEDKLQGFRDLSLDEVERQVLDPSTAKSDLLAIVRERFGGSTGTLTRLPKTVIAERLQTLIMNERGHESISRVASLDSMSSRPEGVALDPPLRPREQNGSPDDDDRLLGKEKSRK